jgi:hypothetical protein
MGKLISAAIFEHAKAAQRALSTHRRASARSPFVPFVPRPPPPGWLDLEGDIAEMFDRLSSRSEAAEEALWRLALWLRSNGLSTPRVAELRKRRRALGLCRECPRPALPGKRRCQAHVLAVRDRAKKKRAEAIATGRCVGCSAPAAPGRMCPKHATLSLERVRTRRDEQQKAGLCTYGRCPEKATRGKYCDEHAAQNVARVVRWQRDGAKKGRCHDCSAPATRGLYCEAHAKVNAARTRARYWQRRGVEVHVEARP